MDNIRFLDSPPWFALDDAKAGHMFAAIQRSKNEKIGRAGRTMVAARDIKRGERIVFDVQGLAYPASMDHSEI